MIKKKNAVELTLLTVATLSGSVMNFATQVLLARGLGVDQFGDFSSSLAIVTIVSTLAGFGLGEFWLNKYGEEGWGAQRWLTASFRFVLFSSIVVMFFTWLWAWLGPHDKHVSVVIMILSFNILGLLAIKLVTAKLQLEGRMIGLSLWQMAPNAMRLVGIVLLPYLLLEENLASVYAASVYFVVAILLLAFGIGQVVKMRKAEFFLEGHPEQVLLNAAPAKPVKLKQVMQGAWPFGLAGIFYVIYFQSDVVLVRYLVDDQAAGVYNSAFVVMVAIYLFPSVLFQKYLLPKLHRWAFHEKSKVERVYRQGNLLMLLFGLVSMIAVWLIMPYVFPWFFGVEYVGAVDLLMVLAIAIPFRFLATSSGSILATKNNIKLKARLMGGVALLNVVLNFIFIPEYRAYGAAYSTVLCDVVLCVLYIVCSRKRLIGNL
ncbi:flippase [Halomonas sp. V046]|uniref:flippase n=1 Tax=Halomonas sp. V046 TaxID=3459611 RepID=UPI004043FF52